MNVSQIIDEIRQNLRTSYPDIQSIPREEIRRQLLFGLQEVGRECDIFRKSVSWSLNSTSKEYEWDSRLLSSDKYHFKRPLCVRYISDIIEPIRYHDYGNLGDTTQSYDGKTHYFINDSDKKIGFYNYASGKTVRVDYAGIPSVSSVSDGASLVLPAEYHDGLIGWATYKMMLRSPQINQVILKEFKEPYLGFMISVKRSMHNTVNTGQIKQYEW